MAIIKTVNNMKNQNITIKTNDGIYTLAEISVRHIGDKHYMYINLGNESTIMREYTDGQLKEFVFPSDIPF